MTGIGASIWLVGKTNAVFCNTSYEKADPAGSYLFFRNQLLNTDVQILTWVETKGMS